VIHVLERTLTLAQPRERVFGFFSDAFNLERITPPELHFRVTTPAPIALQRDTRIRYRLRLYGIPFGWETRIALWDPPQRFVDVQARGPYRLWIHRHEFGLAPDDGTRVRDRVEYALPLGRLGELAHPLVRRQLDRIFAFREHRIFALADAGGFEASAPGAAGKSR
jgi:ligand-binding SRPBCC domain-containing protein